MPGLVVSILLHAALGIGLALVIWGVGAGTLTLIGRGLPIEHAYPLGLLLVTAAAVLLLLTPWLALVAAPLVLVPAAAALRSRLLPLRPLVWALPGVLALPAALGALLHGPTETEGSNAYGDMLFYVNKLVSAGQSVVPFHDLLAEGQRIIYAEASPSFIGAVLDFVPGVDPVLMQATTLPACLLASVCIGIGCVARGASPRPGPVPLVALLCVAMVAYPTWITESPPVALAVPLAFSIYALWADLPAPRWLAGLAAVVAFDLFLTKVVAAMPFAILLAFALYGRYGRRVERRTALLAGAGLLLGAGVVIVLLVLTAGWYADLYKSKFLPADAARGLRRQLDVRDTQALAPALIVAGQLLLALVLYRARAHALLAALAPSVAANWFVGGLGFDIAVGTVVLLGALHLWRTPAVLERDRMLVLAAGATLALSAWFRDISPVRASFVFVTLLAAALYAAWSAAAGARPRRVRYGLGAAAVAAALGLSGHAFVGFLALAILAAIPLVSARASRLALPVAAGVALVLAVVAVREDDFRLTPFDPVLMTADYDLWNRVADVVPPDGLVFTSMTGKQVDSRQGWNNYPSIAGRQLYLAGWYDGRLVSRPEELDRRLAFNRSVLEGRVSPAALHFDRRFGSYFAVLWKIEPAPHSFRRVYENELFAIYRIES